jgi:hypothetical protein
MAHGWWAFRWQQNGNDFTCQTYIHPLNIVAIWHGIQSLMGSVILNLSLIIIVISLWYKHRERSGYCPVVALTEFELPWPQNPMYGHMLLSSASFALYL